jgi:hypothetical protein
MKKTLCYILFLFSLLLCYGASLDINGIIKNTEEISFSLIDMKNKNFFAAVMIKNGTISCGLGGHIETCVLSDSQIKNNTLVVFFEKSKFINSSEGDQLKYRRWIFPKKYKIEFTKEDFDKALKNKWHDLKVIIDTSQTYPATCQAIVIDNLNIRGEPSINSRKIGFLKKRSEITLYEESKNIDEIDGEKNPWYKVKLDDGAYGWVYGGYVRIFFEDPNLGYSDKEKILESIK